ncbi:MAG: TRAP transporter small permease [Pseudomonadota bacterium]
MLDAFERGFERFLRLLAYAGGLVLTALAILVLYEIFMRYFFGRPFRGGFEMTEVAMSVIVACGLPYTAIKDGHVAVDLFSKALDRPALRWLNFAVYALGAAILFLLAWQSGKHAFSALSYGDVTNMMRISLFPFKLGISISAALFAVAVSIKALKALRTATVPEETA